MAKHIKKFIKNRKETFGENWFSVEQFALKEVFKFACLGSVSFALSEMRKAGWDYEYPVAVELINIAMKSKNLEEFLDFIKQGE